MNKKSVYSILIVLTMTMLLIFGGLFTASVLANDDDKIVGQYDNDPDLPGYVLELEFYKFDPPISGTAEGITIDVYDEGIFADWESERPIAYVFVKGGPLGGNLYDYTPGAFSGVGLHVPEGSDGSLYQISHITFYFAKLGDLRITKEFDLGEVIGEVDFPESITVLVTGESYPSGHEVTINIDPTTGSGFALLEDLIPGIYDVEELTFDGSDKWAITGSPAAVDVEAGAEVTAAIVNEYMTGELLITKAFDLGEVSGEVVFPASITVLVTGDSYPSGHEVTIHIDPTTGSGFALLENLIPGFYDVEELSFEGSEVWDSEIVGSPAEVTAGAGTLSTKFINPADVEVAITNTYIPGELEVDKKFLMPDGSEVDSSMMPVDTDYGFTIDLLLGDVLIDTQISTAGEAVLFENLIAGSYTVKERDYGTEWLAVVDETGATVVSGERATATVENEYIPGELEVDKKFLMPDGSEVDPSMMPADTDYGFTIDLFLGDVLIDTQISTDGEAVLFENLIAGSYTVKERDYGDEWLAVVDETGAAVVSGERAAATVENEYIPAKGELLISKQFDLGEVVGDFVFPESITVLVTGESYPDGELVTIYIDPDTGYGEILLEDLIPGLYYVEELTFDGSEEWYSEIVGSPAEVTAGAGGISISFIPEEPADVEVVITNTYIPGELEVDKMFLMPDGSEVDPSMMPADTDYGFTIDLFLVDILIASQTSTAGEAVLFENLIAGSYTVKERDYGTEWLAVVDETGAVVVSGERATATVENEYIPGRIEVSKDFLLPDGSIVDPDSMPMDTDYSFTVELRLNDVLIDTKTGTGDEVLAFEDLIAGTYTVVETAYGSEWTAIVGSADAIVVSGETTEVTLKNEYIIMIVSETAWAAHDIAVYRYTPRGNWATYLIYDELDNGMAEIYAGQDMYVGYVEFIEMGGEVEINIYLEDWAFEPDTTNLYVQDYDSAPSGNPAPGRFDYKETESGSEASIIVPLNDYYGIHLNVYELY